MYTREGVYPGSVRQLCLRLGQRLLADQRHDDELTQDEVAEQEQTCQTGILEPEIFTCAHFVSAVDAVVLCHDWGCCLSV